MNFLTNVLPNDLRKSLLCFTLVNSKVMDGAPDIVTCNRNGYMYEVKNKKIIRTLNLFCRGTSMCCSYLLQNEKLALYYLVLTESHKLLIITRTNIFLQVTKTYGQVKGFDVYDYGCLGFPQIRISFLKVADDLICPFPVETKLVRAEDSKITVDQDNESSPLVESLEEKVQILSKHVDELSEEYNLLRKQLSPKELSTGFGMIPVGSVKFSLPLKSSLQPIIKICDKWVKVFGTSLVLGMKICNFSCETVHDVELLIKHEEIRDYAYRIFQSSDDLYGDLFEPNRTAHPSICPGDEVWAVGAFRTPPFLSHSALSVACCLTSADLKKCLLRESFEVTVLDVASRTSRALEERFTVEDLMAMRTAKSETRLEVRTEDLENGAMGSMMVSCLGFTKIKHAKDELFYCTSTYLNEVVVALRRIAENPSVWKMVLLTSEDSQIYFLVNALYELLPENAAISWGDSPLRHTK